MNLLIDSGNSFIKWALATDDSFITGSRSLTAAASYLRKKWANYDVPSRVIVSNVAGESIAGEISNAVRELWQLDTEFVISSRNCCGLTNSYHKPEQLGVDRWMAMVAAFQMTDGPVIVVDCGTAVTIDLVDEGGLFVGGTIMPGLNTAFQSLRAGTDSVEEISSLNECASPVAQSTEDGVVAGVLFGLAGGIERIISEHALLVDKIPAVFITGGDVEKLVPYLTIPVALQSSLVLEGLRIFSERK